MLREEIKSIQSSKKDLRKFGLTVGLALAVLGGFFFWLGKGYSIYLLAAGPALIVLGYAAPVILKPLQRGWMTAAVVLGWVMTRIILSILFYLVLTTIGFIGRLSGKQFLELKWDRSQPTYWNYRQPEAFDKTRYEKQF